MATGPEQGYLCCVRRLLQRFPGARLCHQAEGFSSLMLQMRQQHILDILGEHPLA